MSATRTPGVPNVSIGTSPAHVVIAGIALRQILSRELYTPQSPSESPRASVAELLHATWTDFADAVAALPAPIEFLLVVGTPADGIAERGSVAFLPLGRGDSDADARSACAEAQGTLWRLLTTVLDYADFEMLDEDALRPWLVHVQAQQVVEIRRSFERLHVSHGSLRRTPAGVAANAHLAGSDEADDTNPLTIDHLYPWIPSDDSWRRLLDTLAAEKGSAAVVVHVSSCQAAPEAARDVARNALAMCERILAAQSPRPFETLLRLQCEVLRQESVRRLAILERRAIAARVFLTGESPASAALLATVAGSVDDASVVPAPSGLEPSFRGGMRHGSAQADDLLTPLDAPTLDLVFGPREATAVLRTPMPVDTHLPGIGIRRARTAPFTGHSGSDTPLGINVHRSFRTAVGIEEAMRFRHCYVVGQTGTGKSTLLAQMILSDLRHGRGVAVLDPHGSLVDAVLEHCPPHRRDDIVLVDPTDHERPVPFNPLALDENDPAGYRRARDLRIDELYSWLDRTYDMGQTGGPMFENQFRGMLTLLLGTEPPPPELVPNLIIFRSLYTNEKLRNALVTRQKQPDVVIEEFLREATAVRGEASLSSLAPYVTSKFSRFLADTTLRNMTCQGAALDVDSIVRDGKVLLFHLAKGRFGDQAAALLASNLVSRLRGAVMKRGPVADAPPFFLYADEFQLFADDRFAELLAEARKFRLGLTLAHQYLEQLPEQVRTAVLGNVGTLVTFRVSGRDAQELQSVYAPVFGELDLASLPNFRACARSFGVLGPTPFTLETEPITAPGSADGAEAIRRQSRQRYGRDVAEVEAEIRATYERYRALAEPS